MILSFCNGRPNYQLLQEVDSLVEIEAWVWFLVIVDSLFEIEACVWFLVIVVGLVEADIGAEFWLIFMNVYRTPLKFVTSLWGSRVII